MDLFDTGLFKFIDGDALHSGFIEDLLVMLVFIMLFVFLGEGDAPSGIGLPLDIIFSSQSEIYSLPLDPGFKEVLLEVFVLQTGERIQNTRVK